MLARYVGTMTTPQLRNFIDGDYVEAAADSAFDLIDPATEEVYGSSPVSSAADVDSAYRARFEERYRERLNEYQRALQSIREQVEYLALDAAEAEPALTTLTRRAVEKFDLRPYSIADHATGVTLATVEEDLDLLPSLHAGALGRLRQIRDAKQQSDEAVEVIRLGDFLPKTQPLSDFSDQEIDEALDKVKQKLYALRELKRRVLWD